MKHTSEIFCALFFCIHTAIASPTPCSEFGAPSLTWVGCAEAAGKAEDEKMGIYMRAAQSQVGSIDLTLAQAAWLRYRMAQCGDVYLYWGAGNYRYEASLKCNIELTRQRIHDIWLAYLAHLDSSPPVLPEP